MPAWLRALIDKKWPLIFLPGLVIFVLVALYQCTMYSIVFFQFLFYALLSFAKSLGRRLKSFFSFWLDFLREFLVPFICVLLCCVAFLYILSYFDHSDPLITSKSATSTPAVRVDATKTPRPTSTAVPAAVPAAVPTAASASGSLSSYYSTRFPSTWAYIVQYSSDPDAYVRYYHDVWGILQIAHGDGIVLGLLTDAQQSLVKYTDIGAAVYLSRGAAVYHATDKCYYLLPSDPATDVFTVPYSVVHKDLTPCPACIRPD